jgi:Holliday junction resolvasome RuvABC DNA-binding subunit
MKTMKPKKLIEVIKNRVIKRLLEISSIDEGSGFDTIFNELKKKLDNIQILPDNVISVEGYKEHEVVDALKEMGYIYRKPIGNKLHFFNKKTSISVYLVQNQNKITLLP